jgi:hypothetical protein
MKASRWSTKPQLAAPISRYSVLEAAGVISLTLIRIRPDKAGERITLQFTREEMQEVLDHAKAGAWVEGLKK